MRGYTMPLPPPPQPLDDQERDGSQPAQQPKPKPKTATKRKPQTVSERIVRQQVHNAKKAQLAKTKSNKHAYSIVVDKEVANTLTTLSQLSGFSIQHLYNLAITHLIKIYAPHYGLVKWASPETRLPPSSMMLPGEPTPMPPAPAPMPRVPWPAVAPTPPTPPMSAGSPWTAENMGVPTTVLATPSVNEFADKLRWD